jgi:hypothetical protein
MNNQDGNFMDFFHSVYFKLFIATSGPLFQVFRSSSSQRPGISKDYERGKALAHSGTLRAPRNPILVFLFFSLGNLGYFTCTFDLKMCPLTLKLIFKVARCVGDHVDISNSAGSYDSAEESFILFYQMVLTRCALAHSTCQSDAKTCPLTAKHVS